MSCTLLPKFSNIRQKCLNGIDWQGRNWPNWCFKDEFLTCLSLQCLWSGASQEAVGWLMHTRDANQASQVYPGSLLQLYQIAGQHSLNYPPSFLFCYLKRLERSLFTLGRNLPYCQGRQGRQVRLNMNLNLSVFRCVLHGKWTRLRDTC